MPLRLTRITHADTASQEAFLRFVPRVFPGLDFRPWYQRGGWTADYEPHALFQDEEIVANVSVMRMRMLVGGRELRGAQLGAVGCLPEMRGRGLMRPLLAKVVERLETETDLLYLYANDEVLDFYPRFGFRRAQESEFELELRLAPAPVPAPHLDLDDPVQRAGWLAACERSLPPTERFGSCNYGPIALWHACVFYPRNVRILERESYAVAVQRGETLHLLDLAAPHRFDLLSVIPRLIEEPISRLRFGFCPELWCPSARVIAPSDEHLFVRGELTFPSTPFKLPLLAQT